MLFHNIGENIPVFRLGEGLYRLQGREGLEAELGNITEKEFSVFGNRLVAVPHIPIMHIPAVFIVGLIEGAA